MLPLGQLTHLPAVIADNPFHRMIVKFSRYKTGSFEILFTIESRLLRHAWLGLILLFALVLPPLEEADYGIATVVRLSTLVYPLFFIWSLTRISGVELMQLVLEGHWTTELLASPLSNRDLMRGFVDPVRLVIRQYLLISIFSLTLYGLETNVIVVDDSGEFYLQDLIRSTLFNYGLFASTIAWIVFVYMARLLAEVRLRNGLIKGLATIALLSMGVLIFAGYCLLFFRYPAQIGSRAVLAGVAGLIVALGGGAWVIDRLLAHHFRHYLSGQLDIDLMIFDETDPRASAWHRFVPMPPNLPASR